jgi:hypothetical protein
MRKIFLTSAYPFSNTENFGPQWLRTHAREDSLAWLTQDPQAADCILFVENHPGSDPYFFEVMRCSLYRSFRHKCVLYHDADLTVTPLPTISPSVLQRQTRGGSKKSVHYIARLTENTTINETPPDWSNERAYTYSFVGSRRTHPLRAKLLRLARTDAYLKDTGQDRAWEMTAERKRAYEAEYVNVVNQSYFILCPRGIGPCTYRLFETMQLGRVPVIIADEWAHITGIAWDQFSITVAESQIEQIPRLLDSRRGEALEMGRRARSVWEEHFSPAASLDTLARAALAVLSAPYRRREWLADQSEFLSNGYHFRGLLRHVRRQVAARRVRS